MDDPVPQKRLTDAAMTIGQVARRIGLLRTGADFLGQDRAAAALGIQPRSLRAKLEASRTVHDDNLRFIATALERHAATALDHATTIRAVLGGKGGTP